MTRRVAIVGIDGSGKSELITALTARASTSAVRAINCPNFHDGFDGPLHQTSRHLAVLGAAADHAQNPVVKAATLYLRMTLFGPVERFVTQTYRPQLLLCERHPIIETLIYAPLYARVTQAARQVSSEDIESLLAAADAIAPGTSDSVARWQEVTAAHSGVGGNLMTTLDEVVSILDTPLTTAMGSLANCFRTHLPEAIIWLDISVDEAMSRIRRRDETPELHENESTLKQLRKRYEVTLPQLKEMGTEVCRITNITDRATLTRTCLEFMHARNQN